MSSQKKVVLVTGGSGMVGKAVKTVVEQENPHDEEWVFLSSKDANLMDKSATEAVIEKYKPTHVLHLAACYGSLYMQLKRPCDYYTENMFMTVNLLEASKNAGVEKVVTILTTCIFPNKTVFPLDESMIQNGPPHDSVLGYSYSKRMVTVMNRAYNKQFGCKFTSVIPTNLFGPHDNFSCEEGNVLATLIHKGYLAKSQQKPFTIFGTGIARRQFLYTLDLAKLLLWSIRHYDEIDPVIIAPDEEDEYSIMEMAEIVLKTYGLDCPVITDPTKSDGQIKKTASNAKLRKYLPDFKFTPLEQGIKETSEWFQKNYNIARK